jgi:hypothetical protein
MFTFLKWSVSMKRWKIGLLAICICAAIALSTITPVSRASAQVGGGIGGGGTSPTVEVEHLLFTNSYEPHLDPLLSLPQNLDFESTLDVDVTYSGNTQGTKMYLCPFTNEFHRVNGLDEWMFDMSGDNSTEDHDLLTSFTRFTRTGLFSTNPTYANDPWYPAATFHTEFFARQGENGVPIPCMPGVNNFPCLNTTLSPNSSVSVGSVEFKENINGMDFIILRDIYFTFNRRLGDANEPDDMRLIVQVERHQDFQFEQSLSISYVSNNVGCNFLGQYQNIGCLGNAPFYTGYIRYAETCAHVDDQVNTNMWRLRVVLTDNALDPDDWYRSSGTKYVYTY